MKTSASLGVVAALAAFNCPSLAQAETPRETLVRQWLETAAFGLPVTIGGSNFDPATQTVTLSDVSIGELDDDLIAVHFDELSVEDPRLAPGDAFAAHAVRASNYKVDIHYDVAKWFPGLAALESGSSGKEPDKAASPAPKQKPAKKMQEESRSDNQTDDKTPSAPERDSETETTAPPVVDYSFSAETMLVERLVFPRPPKALPSDRPVYETVFSYAGWMTSVRADWAEVNEVRLETSGMSEGDFVTTYSLAYMSGMHDGRVERAGINSMEQKPKDETSPLKSVTIDSTYVIGTDFGKALEALDPAKYVGGVGDGRARTIYSQYGLNNIVLAFDGATASIGNIEANNVFLRQTNQPVIKQIMEALGDPKQIEADPITFISTVLPNYTQLMGVGLVRASKIEVKADDESFDFGVNSFDGNDISGNGIGAFTLRDITASSKDTSIKGSLSLLTLQDIRFGSLASLLDLGKSASEGNQPSGEAMREALVNGGTSFGFIELSTLSVESPLGSVGLSSLALTSGDYMGTLPQRSDFTFTSLSLPVALLMDETVVSELTGMGYETLDVSGGLTVSWDAEKGDLHLEDLTLKAADMGAVSSDFHLDGLPLSLIEKPEEIEARMKEANLVSASVTYGNGGIVEKAFEAQAKKNGQDGDKLRENIAGALPLMLSFLEDPKLQAKFEKPIADFIKDPKSITLTMAPDKPVPFAELEKVNTDKPNDLIRLLNVGVIANQ
ncbi:hypothetical protein CXZ10_05350 [Pleomorphomonas diazotrophica]|uniref:Aminoacyl-transfer RNA synthetases class-II family profile domain-containing protein n=1 Tax=Pleomorphomonas diazotrophica TaxID=1166257 RepID=A0A1I4QBT1_9HYPH|nr:hypothetical protein [Pleomorphomonas diazotrophica]PKR90780.1 hypothetical protein CXZ10_05350 [Pleomorphomonas diazotrophica]SFM37562.1 hypothetical protein SAMN05192571_101242 [Pleomorphomonas diazotrophica]